MTLFAKAATLEAQIAILMALGYFAQKTGIISKEGRKNLANLILRVTLPVSIFNSFLSGTSSEPDLKKNLVVMILCSAFLELFAYGIAFLLFRNRKNGEKEVLSVGILCSNSSYMGLPVGEALFGSIGVVYTAVLQIPYRIALWILGIGYFIAYHEHRKGNTEGIWKKVLINPCIIATELGLIAMAANITLPSFLSATITSLGKCTTPMAMMVTGAILADIPIRKAFDRQVILYSALRLILFPAAIWACLTFLPIDRTVLGIAVIQAAMPAASNVAVLAEKYECNPILAAQIVSVTTVLSFLTIPIVCLLL